MKILFTGATGTIGKKLLPALLANYTVMVLGRKSPDLEHPNLEFQKCDLSQDSEIVLSTKEKIDCIVHLAGLASGEGKTEEDYFQINANSVKLLLELAYKLKIPRMIYASSTSVYGESKVSCKETSPMNGKTYYARSKIEAEFLLINSEIDACILRFSSVYGKDAKSAINKLVSLAKKKIILVPNSGKPTKSFVHLEDAVNCVQICIKKKLTGIYNISYPQPVDFREISNTIHFYFPQAFRVPIPVFLWKVEAFVMKVLGKQSKLRPLFENSLVNSQKIQVSSGYQFLYNFQKGFKDCI